MLANRQLHKEQSLWPAGKSIPARDAFPRFYPILDAGSIARYRLDLFDTAQALFDAGVAILQYRDKDAQQSALLRNAVRLAAMCGACRLVMNDHTATALAAGIHAVHVGQKDTSVDEAFAILGDDAVVGLSTHTSAQIKLGDAGSASYLAIGPVFGTVTKADAEPIVGLAGVQSARMLTHKPLVAIGGITLERAVGVIEAGADAIAVISDLYSGGTTASVSKRAQDFIDLLK